MEKRIFIYMLLFAFVFSQSVFAAINSKNNKPNNLNYSDKLQSYVLHAPAGVKTDAVLSQEINSKTAVVGQAIYAILTEDFMYNNQLIAPSGSIICGNIVYNKKAGIAGKSAQMQIIFTTIRTPYNNVIPISAIIATNDSTGILKGISAEKKSETLHSDKPEIAKTVAAKGDDIYVPSNSKINLVFNQPITLGAP